ncbi:hypothetical protein BBP40_007918 [Aspergillus hancockii]|nr:hypothetical protein BBP40_007918 [Aspergillus hancockii]
MCKLYIKFATKIARLSGLVAVDLTIVRYRRGEMRIIRSTFPPLEDQSTNDGGSLHADANQDRSDMHTGSYRDSISKELA